MGGYFLLAVSHHYFLFKVVDLLGFVCFDESVRVLLNTSRTNDTRAAYYRFSR